MDISYMSIFQNYFFRNYGTNLNFSYLFTINKQIGNKTLLFVFVSSAVEQFRLSMTSCHWLHIFWCTVQSLVVGYMTVHVAKFGPITRLYLLFQHEILQNKPTVSEVLTNHLKRRSPAWTSFFIKYESVINDHFGMSHFNWSNGKYNYHILRTGCYPYMKYHCSRRPIQDLSLDDSFYKFIKILNLGKKLILVCRSQLNQNFISLIAGLPTLAYGTVARYLITWTEQVQTSKGTVPIYFLIKENYDAIH